MPSAYRPDTCIDCSVPVSIDMLALSIFNSVRVSVTTIGKEFATDSLVNVTWALPLSRSSTVAEPATAESIVTTPASELLQVLVSGSV